MQAKAITKFVRISPTKVRPVMDLVRGKPVERALAILDGPAARANLERVFGLLVTRTLAARGTPARVL